MIMISIDEARALVDHLFGVADAEELLTVKSVVRKLSAAVDESDAYLTDSGLGYVS